MSMFIIDPQRSEPAIRKALEEHPGKVWATESYHFGRFKNPFIHWNQVKNIEIRDNKVWLQSCGALEHWFMPISVEIRDENE